MIPPQAAFARSEPKPRHALTAWNYFVLRLVHRVGIRDAPGMSALAIVEKTILWPKQ
jgi:hypothetical protein